MSGTYRSTYPLHILTHIPPTYSSLQSFPFAHLRPGILFTQVSAVNRELFLLVVSFPLRPVLFVLSSHGTITVIFTRDISAFAYAHHATRRLPCRHLARASRPAGAMCLSTSRKDTLTVRWSRGIAWTSHYPVSRAAKYRAKYSKVSFSHEVKG